MYKAISFKKLRRQIFGGTVRGRVYSYDVPSNSYEVLKEEGRREWFHVDKLEGPEVDGFEILGHIVDVKFPGMFRKSRILTSQSIIYYPEPKPK